MKLILIVSLCALTMYVLPAGGDRLRAAGQERQISQKKTGRYTCPMHPSVTSKWPGKCSKCGMSLRWANDEGSSRGVLTNDAADVATMNTGFIFSQRIPEARVYDQNGRRLSFYTDLIKGKAVAINFIFTTCTTSCPLLTATFRRVQQELGARMAGDVRLISISVDPTVDTPERLNDFASRFKAGPGWTFVTGEKSDIDPLLQALGAATANKNDHSPMILVGNDATGYWTRAFGLSSPATLAKVITEVADHK